MKYTAIKVQGMAHWLWFENSKIERKDGKFIGKAGWGKGGAFTEIDIWERLIEGTILSDTTQYLN